MTDTDGTRNVIDALRNDDLNSARDKTQAILYKKSAEEMAATKLKIASTIGKPNAELDAPVAIEPTIKVEPVDYVPEPTTGE